MGVGYPEDLVVSVALGADMFDCVWPTRTAVRLSAALEEFQVWEVNQVSFSASVMQSRRMEYSTYET